MSRGVHQLTRRDWVILVALSLFVVFYLWPILDLFRAGMDDEGDALEVACRVVDGQVPYRDFFYFTAPAGIYMTAAWIAIFGKTLISFRGFFIATAVLSTVLLYRLGRTILPASWTVLATLCFVSQSFPLWPIVSYHWLEVPFYLGAVLCLMEYDQRPGGQRSLILACGFLAGTAGFILQDGIFPALALLISRFFLRPFKQALREGLLLIAGMGLGVLPWLLLTCGQGTLGKFWEDCVTHVLFTGYVPFNKGRLEPMPWALIKAGTQSVVSLNWRETFERWREVSDFLTWPLVMFVEYALFIPLAFAALMLARNKSVQAPDSAKLYALTATVCGAAAYCRLSYDINHVAFMRHIWWIVIVWAFGYLPWESKFRARWIALLGLGVFMLACGIQLFASRARLARGQFFVAFPRGTVRVEDAELAQELDRIRRAVDVQAGSDGYVMIYPFSGLLGRLLGNPSPTAFSRLCPIYNRPEHFQSAFQDLKLKPTTVILSRMDYPVFLKLYPAVPADRFIRIDQDTRARLTSLAKGEIIHAQR